MLESRARPHTRILLMSIFVNFSISWNEYTFVWKLDVITVPQANLITLINTVKLLYQKLDSLNI